MLAEELVSSQVKKSSLLSSCYCFSNFGREPNAFKASMWREWFSLEQRATHTDQQQQKKWHYSGPMYSGCMKLDLTGHTSKSLSWVSEETLDFLNIVIQTIDVGTKRNKLVLCDTSSRNRLTSIIPSVGWFVMKCPGPAFLITPCALWNSICVHTWEFSIESKSKKKKLGRTGVTILS